MTPAFLLSLLIEITLVIYGIQQLAEWLNLRANRSSIPPEMESYYDREKYARAMSYQRDVTRFGFLTSALSTFITVLLLWLHGFGKLDAALGPSVQSDIWRALSFFAVLAIASDLLTLPFQIYRTFVIEKRYGFNRMTIPTFFADKLKGYAIAALMGAPLLALLIYLIEYAGPLFWIYFAAIIAIVLVAVNRFYASLFVPLFNKLTPLPDGSLRTAIEQFARRVQFPLQNMMVMDGSKRSSKANAFFAGLGRKRRVVLFDTLIEKHSTEELVAIVAHEVGHYKKGHIVTGLILSIVQITVTLFLLSQVVYSPAVSEALGGAQWTIHLNLVAFSVLYSPLTLLSSLPLNWFSRKHEFEADRFAVQTYDGAALAEGLKKLSVDSLTNLYPHPLYVALHYSHPPLLERLSAISLATGS